LFPETFFSVTLSGKLARLVAWGFAVDFCRLSGCHLVPDLHFHPCGESSAAGRVQKRSFELEKLNVIDGNANRSALEPDDNHSRKLAGANFRNAALVTVALNLLSDLHLVPLRYCVAM